MASHRSPLLLPRIGDICHGPQASLRCNLAPVSIKFRIELRKSQLTLTRFVAARIDSCYLGSFSLRPSPRPRSSTFHPLRPLEPLTRIGTKRRATRCHTRPPAQPSLTPGSRPIFDPLPAVTYTISISISTQIQQKKVRRQIDPPRTSLERLHRLSVLPVVSGRQFVKSIRRKLLALNGLS